MLSGFNTNVRHRGLVLHVQTEDSGRAHPHIITHLYHGGTILASERSQYRDRLGSERLSAEVRALMEGQHRAMLRRLRSGELDARLIERLGSDALAGDASGVTASGATGPTSPAVAGPDTPSGTPEGPPSGERPLDALVLDYLVERARRAAREGA